VRKREEIESEEGITTVWCRLYFFSLLDNIKGRFDYFSMDIAQTG